MKLEVLRDRKLRTLQLVALATLVAILLAGSGASAQQPTDAARIQEESLTREFGISHAEARSRIDRQAQVAELQVRTRAMFPSSFAGLWVDHGDQGRVHIAFTAQPTAALQAVGRGFSRSDLLVAATAVWSMEQLEALLAEVARHRPLVSEPFDVKIDVPGNSVVISTPSVEGEAALYFRNLDTLEDVPIRLEVGVARPNTCTRTDCDPNMRSGLQVGAPVGTCSTAFSARNGLGRTGQLTAAHCGSGQFFHQGTMGFSDAFQQGGDVDGQFVRLLPGFNPTNLMYVSILDPAWTVTAVETYSSAFVGQSVCSSGRTTGYSCGTVVSKNVSLSYVPGSSRFIQATYCSLGGDSGAGVMSGHTAVGINSGSIGSHCGNSNGFYGHIEHATQALGVTIVTN